MVGIGFCFFLELYLVKPEISKGPKCTSQMWKFAVIGLRFFPLKSADVLGAGTRDEPLRTSAWKAKWFVDSYFDIEVIKRIIVFVTHYLVIKNISYATRAT